MSTSKTSLIPAAALPPHPQAPVQDMVASDWKGIDKDALLGRFNLRLQSGLILIGCALLRKGDSRWVSLPSQSWQAPSGEKKYTAIVDFRDGETKKRFLAAAKDAIDRLLEEQGGAA